MWYRLLLKTPVFNYRKDKVLSELILKYVKLGIEKIEYTQGTITIHFSKGALLHGYNASKYFAWLSEGYIENKLGKLYVWRDARPSAKAIYKLEQAILAYHREQ